jgi:hypothetical protein
MGQLIVKDTAQKFSMCTLRRFIKDVEEFVIFLAAVLTILSLLGLPTSFRYLLYLLGLSQRK